MKSITIIGNGWLGKACANYFVENGYQIKVTNRNSSNESNIVQSYIWKLGEVFPEDAASDIILIAIAERENILQNYINLYKQLEELSVKKIIFISSSSVYNGLEGECTEDRSVILNSDNTVGLKEETLKQTHIKYAILRLSGLVGPGRNPARFLAGKKDVANPNLKINLVHQFDVIQFIERCIELDLHGIYNVCSSAHPSRKDFYTEVCALENLASPEFAEDTEADRWVSNAKSKLAGNFEYKYDDLLQYYRRSTSKD